MLVHNPYEDVDFETDTAAKGEFHTHADETGETPPAHELVDLYESKGYDVLCISSKSYAPSAYPWREFSEIEDHWEDRYPIGYHDETDDQEKQADLVAIQGNEQQQIEHIINLGLDMVNEDYLPEERLDMSQHDGGNYWRRFGIEEVEDRDGCCFLAHCGRYYETVDRWERYVTDYRRFEEETLFGFEVWNRTNRYPEDEDMYSKLLSAFSPFRPIWALSSGDPNTEADIGHNWTTVFTDELESETIIDHMIEGHMTASVDYSGDENAPELTDVTVDETAETITVTGESVDQVEWFAEGEVIGTGSTIDYGQKVDDGEIQNHVFPKLIEGDNDGETIVQPFMFGREQ